MASNWVLLHNIPSTGKEFTLEDQSVWADPLAEFSVPCTIIEPLKAAFTVYVQDEGVLIRGRISGKVALPCNRCTEDAEAFIDQTVDAFEPFPPGEPGEEDPEVDRELVRTAPAGQGVEINLAALAWEEFSLALPMKPLCSASCKGLCPICGANRNTTPCACETDNLDPRMASLRGLKVGR